jgi:hypothetical protein
MEKAGGAIIGIIVLVAIMILGIVWNWWPLSNVLLNIIPFFITAGIIALFAWGFKARIENRFNKNSNKSISTSSSNNTVVQSQITKGVTKVLGHPDSVENGIQIYNKRSYLPLNELLSEAQHRIDMLAVTFHSITTIDIQKIRETLYRGVQITFLILDPNSKYAENRHDDFHEGEEVKHHIERSLDILCRERNKLSTLLKNNLIIKTYNEKINNSIIMIDNKIIKIEQHQIGSSPDSRRNLLAFKNDNNSFFEQYSTEYNNVDSKDYECP